MRYFWFDEFSVLMIFVVAAYQFYKDSSSASSRKLFRYSLLHLPVIMFLFLINKKKWFVFEENEEINSGTTNCDL